jgi:hypothetical protein
MVVTAVLQLLLAQQYFVQVEVEAVDVALLVKAGSVEEALVQYLQLWQLQAQLTQVAVEEALVIQQRQILVLVLVEDPES